MIQHMSEDGIDWASLEHISVRMAVERLRSKSIK